MYNTQFEENNTPVSSSNHQLRNRIITVLAICLVGLAVYFIAEKNSSEELMQQQQSQINKVTDEKSEIRKSFDASLSRLDSMSTVTSNLQDKLEDKNVEITKVKKEIRSILNKKNATEKELANAKNLIAALNDNICSLEAEVARLTGENKVLNDDNAALTMVKQKLTQDLAVNAIQRQELEKKVDVGSTLNASHISIIPINQKNNGKEKASTIAKRVDKFLISFVVDNRIAQPGSTDIFVLVIGPDGKPVTIGNNNTSTFNTREDGEKTYTAKVPVELETAKKKNVEFGFVPGTAFQTGSYKVQIYQNGFLIGESITELKKGSLFS